MLNGQKAWKMSIPKCHYQWISSGTIWINQCMAGCYFDVSALLRSCTQSQILKLQGPSRDQLAERPPSRKKSVIYTQWNNGGMWVLGRSCALAKLTQPVNDRAKTRTLISWVLTISYQVLWHPWVRGSGCTLCIGMVGAGKVQDQLLRSGWW